MNVDKSSGTFFPLSADMHAQKGSSRGVQEGGSSLRGDTDAQQAGQERGSFQEHLRETVQANREAQQHEKVVPLRERTSRLHKEQDRPNSKDEISQGKSREPITDSAKPQEKRVEPSKDRESAVVSEPERQMDQPVVEAAMEQPQSDAMEQPQSDAMQPEVVELDPQLAQVLADALAAAQSGNDTRSAAAGILKDAVTEIVEVLSLKVGAEIGDIELSNPNEYEKEQLAEIIAALKGIGSVLSQAVALQEALVVNGQMVEPAELEQLDTVVRGGLFRIEYAANMLGLAAELAQKVAEKTGAMSTGGIAVASDLSQVSHPVAAQLKALVKESDTSEDTLEALVRKFASALKGESAGSDLQQNQAALNRSLIDKVRNPLAEIGGLNPEIRRHLLTQESGETAQENQSAADLNAKMDLPKTQGIVLGRSFVVENNTVNPAAAGATTDESGALSLLKDLSSLEPRGSRIAERVEQAVMQQVASRLQSAVKAGLGSHEIRMLLRPEALGEVRLRVQMEGDIVITRIHVENQQVKQIIENNLQSLKNALAEHNIQTGAFSVDVGSGQAGQSWDREQSGVQRSAMSGESEQDNTSENSPESLRSTPGVETGHRYGNNSIEYFA